MIDFLRLCMMPISRSAYMICFLCVVLFADCFLGKRFKLNGWMWLTAVLLIPYSIIVQLVVESGAMGVVFSLIALGVVESVSVAEIYENPILFWLIYFGVFFYCGLYFFFAQEKHVWWKRLLMSILLSILPIYLESYCSLLFQTIFSVILGSFEKYAHTISYGEGWISFVSVSLELLFLIGLLLLLYFGPYRRGVRMKISVFVLILFVLWTHIFSSISQAPFSELLSYETGSAICRIYVAIMMPLVGMAFPIIIGWIILSMRQKERMAVQDSYLAAELEYIEQYKKKENETRAFRHDMINQLSLLEMNLEAGKVEESKEHLMDLLGKTRAFSPRFNTGDEMLDCIVSMKCEKMEEEGIAFTCDGVCDGGLNLKPTDICCIFANALDNAIEACIAQREKRKKETEDPAHPQESAKDAGAVGDVPLHIDLKITRTPAFFVFKLSNPCDENLDAESIYDPNVIVTTKKDTRHHGFGTKNLLRVVTGYEGMVKAERQDRTFILGITLPRKQEA